MRGSRGQQRGSVLADIRWLKRFAEFLLFVFLQKHKISTPA
jgi:hypothetical protein